MIISSGLSDDSSCISDSFSSSTSGESSTRRRRKPKTKDSREVVTPPPFDSDGRLPLRNFFSLYEKYFRSKFRGTAFDMCQQLEPFLQGELLGVYKARGGRLLKYSTMKRTLEKHYKKLKKNLEDMPKDDSFCFKWKDVDPKEILCNKVMNVS